MYRSIPVLFRISALVALASFDVAFRLWLSANIGMTIVGTWLVSAPSPLTTSRPCAHLPGWIGLRLFNPSNRYSIFIEQSSSFYIRLAALIWVCSLTPLLLVLGLFLTPLNPHIGLVESVSVLPYQGSAGRPSPRGQRLLSLLPKSAIISARRKDS